jgi:hypothetical protein
VTDKIERQLSVQIVRFVDDSFPGWVACEFEDADGHRHTLIDKVPGFTEMMFDSTSIYPQDGYVACEVVERWSDTEGRDLVRINTEKPYGISSTQGLSEFVILSSQLVAS